MNNLDKSKSKKHIPNTPSHKINLIREFLQGEIRKTLCENDYGDLTEMARKATVLKIGDKDKAQAVIEKIRAADKKTWIADMIEKVIEAGDEGITQVDLAFAVGKVAKDYDKETGENILVGRQQAINPEVRSFLSGGIFVLGTNTVDVPDTQITAEPEELTMASEPSSEPVDNSISEPESTDLDYDEKYLKPEEEDEEEEIEPEEIEDEEGEEEEDTYFKSEEEEEEEEDEPAQKFVATGNVDRLKMELDRVVSDMKNLAAEYKKSKLDNNKEKELEIVSKLKEKTALKSKLEDQIETILGGDIDDEL